MTGTCAIASKPFYELPCHAPLADENDGVQITLSEFAAPLRFRNDTLAPTSGTAYRCIHISCQPLPAAISHFTIPGSQSTRTGC